MLHALRALCALLLLAACADYDSQYGAARSKLTEEIESGDLSGEALATAYLKRGYTLELDKQYDRALADYNQAVATAPQLADAYSMRAPLLRGLGRFDEALADASQVTALLPSSDPTGYLLRGDILQTKGDYVGAVAAYDEALKRDPKNWLGYGARGVVLAQLGEEDRALVDLDRAIELDPGTLGKQTSRSCYTYGAQTTPHCNTYDTDVPTFFIMMGVHRSRGMILYKRGDYVRAADDLMRAGTDKDTYIYGALASFAVGKCKEGHYSLHLLEDDTDIDKDSVIAANRDFIAKTPCAADVLDD
jgi:tetratricopeptide (TPR) repeat protein